MRATSAPLLFGCVVLGMVLPGRGHAAEARIPLYEPGVVVDPGSYYVSTTIQAPGLTVAGAMGAIWLDLNGNTVMGQLRVMGGSQQVVVRNGAVQGQLWVSGQDCVVEDVIVSGDVRLDGVNAHLRRLTVAGEVAALYAQSSSLSDMKVRSSTGMAAVTIDSCTGLVVERVQVETSNTPLRIQFSENVEVRECTFRSDFNPVEILGGRLNQIRDSRLSPVQLMNTQEVLLAGNHVGNPGWPNGIWVDSSSEQAVIRDNEVVACFAGMQLDGSGIVRDNVLEGYSSTGLDVQGTRWVIEGNVLRGTPFGGTAIEVRGSENVLRRNTVHHASGGEGITIDDFAFANLILDNSITVSGVAGLHLRPGSSGNVYRGNTVTNSAGVEIQDDNPAGNEPPAGGFTIDPLGNVSAF